MKRIGAGSHNLGSVRSELLGRDRTARMIRLRATSVETSLQKHSRMIASERRPQMGHDAPVSALTSELWNHSGTHTVVA
jgi:hypothetical protein